MKQDNSAWLLLDSRNQPVCEYEGILSVQVTESADVLSEPLENGQFASYNKVQSPNSINVQLVIGSNPATQKAALTTLTALKKGTDLAALYTPSKIYPNLALVEISQSRSQSEGASLLVVDLTFQEIRSAFVGSQTVQWQPKDPGAGNEVDGGRKSLLATGADMTLKQFGGA